MKFRIPVPGVFPKSKYGKTYYAMTKAGNLAIVGEDAPKRTLNRYDLWFDNEAAEHFELQYIHHEYRL